MLNDLLLLSGNDIPFEAARLLIHQPTIKDIAVLGEENFYFGCQLLNFSKDILSEEDKVHLEAQTNFDILMSIMMRKDKELQEQIYAAIMVLNLIFPNYTFEFFQNRMEIKIREQSFFITNDNFEDFKKILSAMFCLSSTNEDEYNPEGSMAERIAEKLKKRHQKLAELNGQSNSQKKISVLSRYISILTVGEKKDINDFLKQTVQQLHDEQERYLLKTSFDIHIQAKMAGAQNLEDADDWMKDIHP